MYQNWAHILGILRLLQAIKEGLLIAGNLRTDSINRQRSKSVSSNKNGGQSSNLYKLIITDENISIKTYREVMLKLRRFLKQVKSIKKTEGVVK